MNRVNPQLTAIAFLVKKFGQRISGGYEVHVAAADMMEMSPHGTFQEIPDIDGRGVRWQYFPNEIIDLKPGDWKESTSDSAIVKLPGETDK